MKANTYTNWTTATTNPSKAMLGLISCLESGKNAWIEVQKNGEQDFPIQMKNPILDSPFNWTMAYGVPRNENALLSHKYFNETEKDLTNNYIACFGEQKAIDVYQSSGKITEGLILSMGKCHPVKISDANKYRNKITGDNYEYNYWATFWKPIDKIPYWVVDDSIHEVFVVCYNDEPADKKDTLMKASQFLAECANIT